MAGETLNIGAMPVEQLNALRESIQDENRFLTASFSQLRMARSKFMESRDCLKTLTPENVGTPVMVPITASLYVKGTLAETDRVLVDVGTGYFVEKAVPDADDYLKRKVGYLTDNLERLEANIVEKRKNLEAVTMVLQAKVMEQRAAAAAAAGGGGN